MAGGDVVEFRFQATSGQQKKSRDSVGGAEVVPVDADVVEFQSSVIDD
jgi:hypothetical protein